MGLNINLEIKLELQRINISKWAKNGVEYPGIILTDNYKYNLDKWIQESLNRWFIVKLSWLDCLAVIKRQILPIFIFIFQNLILDIPQQQLHVIQSILNKFIGGYNKPRIHYSVMQQKTECGRLSCPNIVLYYHAALIKQLLYAMVIHSTRCSLVYSTSKSPDIINRT